MRCGARLELDVAEIAALVVPLRTDPRRAAPGRDGLPVFVASA
jgi:hypothetical protein